MLISLRTGPKKGDVDKSKERMARYARKLGLHAIEVEELHNCLARDV
jgi:hypothetical protein